VGQALGVAGATENFSRAQPVLFGHKHFEPESFPYYQQFIHYLSVNRKPKTGQLFKRASSVVGVSTTLDGRSLHCEGMHLFTKVLTFLNSKQPKLFGVNFSFREIGRIFPVKMRNF